MVFSKFKVGQKCKCLHPYAYRGETPFTIIRIIPKFKDAIGKIHAVYEVQYSDGKIDQIPVKDEGGYLMVCIEEA